MKAMVGKWSEVTISTVLIDVPVRYEEEDIPNDFPLRAKNRWVASVNVDTGQIVGWPEDAGAKSLHMKVCDGGTYTLYGPDEQAIASIQQDYIPNRLIPGEYGDYIELHIKADGVVENWPKAPCVDDFFKQDD